MNDDNDAIRRDYATGMLLREILAKYGISYHKIRAIVEGVSRTKPVPERDQRIIHDYQNTDMTYRQLADKYGVSFQRIEQILNKWDVIIPNRHLDGYPLESIREEIRQLNGTMGIVKMSKQLRISRPVIRRVLGDDYIQVPVGRRSKYTQEQRDEAVRMYGDGMSYNAVGKSLGLPAMTVHRWVNQSDAVETRPKGRYAR